MAGLFSKKKKEKDDRGGLHRDNSSANNSITNSEYSQQHHPYSHQPNNGPSSFSSKNSLQQHHGPQQHNHHPHNGHMGSHSGNLVSATSINSMNNMSLKSTSGPWSSGMVMSTNPFPRFAHSASYVSTGNDIYVFGGIVKGSPQKDVHVIDTQSLHCQLLPVSGSDGPPPTNGHSAVALGQYVMFFGGKDAKNKSSDTLYVLHTARKEWNKPKVDGLLPPPRHSHAACVIGTVMYIIGGRLTGYYMNDIAAFDMKTLNGNRARWNQIEPKSDLPPARAGHCAAAYDGKVYIFGGADDKYFYNDIWCYDPAINKWEPVPAYGILPTSRHGHAVSVVDDTMYIYGGRNHEEQLLGDLACFKFTDRRWTLHQNTLEWPVARTEHAMTNVNDKIYILGGQLDLNTNEESGSIHVLDTARLRSYDPSLMSSQRSAYDNDSSVRADGGQDPSSPDSSRFPQDYDGHFQDSRRQNHPQQQQYNQQDQYANQNQQHQQQQRQPHIDQQRYNDHHDQYSNQQQYNDHDDSRDRRYQQEQNAPRNNNFAEESNLHAQSPSRLSMEFAETTHVARRRTIGKPVGYMVQDVEPRATQSIDEIRRAVAQENRGESFEHSRSMSQRQNQITPTSNGYTEPEDRSYGHHNGVNGYNKGNNAHAAVQHLSQLDLARQGSLNENLNRGASYTSITHVQTPASRSSVDPSQRTPLRVTNPEHERLGHPQQSSSARSTPTPSLREIKEMVKTDDSKDLKDIKQREQWLLAEVSMARKKMGERPLSVAIMALEDELEACEVDSEKYRIMQLLLNVKAELERSKTSIVTQAQAASNKVREAERVRTLALQEAAYLKAKVNALQSGEVSALVSTESARAVDLEKRLTQALALVDKFQVQVSQYESILEHERQSRELAEEREQEASSRAADAQGAHTRALAELSNLHERASVAESNLREFEAKHASSEAGLSSYQQQSSALFSQISTLKTTVDHQKKSLEKAKMAYSVANDRAEHADRLWNQSRQEVDTVQMELADVRADLDRSQRETDRWRTKANDTELLWQKAKSENEAMRVLLEEDMNSAHSPAGAKDRKHDSIMAITSASRLAELEHELGTLRQLLRESQAAATKANRELGDTMVRISQLEQSSMSARAEAAVAQRQLTEYKDKAALFQAQLIRKEEDLEEMAREQENNEVQLGLLRGVMKENGLMADDVILEALSQGEGKGSSSAVNGLKIKVQDAEKRAEDAESQLEELFTVKKHQEERIQQLEADYQTAVTYVQGSEDMMQRLRDEAKAVRNEKDSIRANLKELETRHAMCGSGRNNGSNEANSEMEEEVADLHQQLHFSQLRTQELEEKMESLSERLADSESRAEASQMEFKALKTKHMDQKKRGANQVDVFQSKMDHLEACLNESQVALAETRQRLEKSQVELEQAHKANRATGRELNDALASVRNNASSSSLSIQRQEELENVIENAQRKIQALQQTNEDLASQLRASENKISLLLDNYQGPDSVRNSMASLSGAGGEELMRMLSEANASPQLPSQSRFQQSLASSPSPSFSNSVPRSGSSANTLAVTSPTPPSASASASMRQQQLLAASQQQRHHQQQQQQQQQQHGGDRSSPESLASELELLKTPWGQSQIQGSLSSANSSNHHSPSASPAPASPMAMRNHLRHDPHQQPQYQQQQQQQQQYQYQSSSSPAAAASASSAAAASAAIAASRGQDLNKNGPLATSQKLEEYERMIQDMANVRRQYDE